VAVKVINELELTGKRVFIRVDFNVPKDKKTGQISDDTRIREALPTIRFALEKQAKVILASHFGRPQGKVVPEMSLLPVAQKLSELLAQDVVFPDDCIGDGVRKNVQDLGVGGVILLENLRFHPEEEKNDPAFAQKLAELCDVYINDAFGTAHRAHASTAGMAALVQEKAVGFLMQKEIQFLSKLLNVSEEERPFVAILGGAKISDKIGVVENLLNKVDCLLVCGGMAYTFLKAQNIEVGKSLLETDKVPTAQKLLKRAKTKKIPLLLPEDHVVAPALEKGVKTQVVGLKKIPADQMALDIGPATIARYVKEIKKAKTIFWNGPAGAFEIPPFDQGTLAIAQAVAASGAMSVIGGGDSVAAVHKAGVADKITHISTGGGASLEFVEGIKLPGIAALEE